MTKAEAHQMLDDLRAGRIDAREPAINEALRATGDLSPWWPFVAKPSVPPPRAHLPPEQPL